jgi:putative FmdB family regulatory protein
MPLYEYKCPNPKCEKEFERLLSHKEGSKPQKCPECGTVECKRQISQTSFSLKGGGWAADGYGS